jgi:hypothetical protein
LHVFSTNLVEVQKVWPTSHNDFYYGTEGATIKMDMHSETPVQNRTEHTLQEWYMRPLSSIFFQIHATYIATFSITGYIALDWISSFSSMVSPGSSSLSSSFYSMGKLKFFCAFLWGSKYPWGFLSFKENNSVKWRGTYRHYTRMRLVLMQPSQKKVFVCHQSRRQLFSLGLQMCLPKFLQPSSMSFKNACKYQSGNIFIPRGKN